MPFMQLILVTGIAATIVAGAVIYQLYSIKLDVHREELQNLVRDQALNPVSHALLECQLLLDISGKSGRIIAAKIIDGKIHFFHFGNGFDREFPEPSQVSSNEVSPIRSALYGVPLIAQTVDEQGDAILAASHPVKSLSIALAAGVDLAEIREPYIL